MIALRITLVGTLFAIALPAAAQSPRDALIEGLRQYQEFEWEAAEQNLMVGLDPAFGIEDVLWPQGVWRLAQLQIDRGDTTVARTWLRWAVRLDPDLRADEQTPSVVIQAIEDAKAYVRSIPHDDAAIQIEYRWTSAVRTASGGSVRIEVSDTGDVPLRSFGVRLGASIFVRENTPRDLPMGSHRLNASAPNFLPANHGLEILPGVTTIVTLSLLPQDAGHLAIQANPWGAVWLDYDLIGYTPIIDRRLPPGTYRVRLARDGTLDTDTTIVIDPEARLSLNFGDAAIAPDPTLQLAIDAWADIEVDRSAQLLRQAIASLERDSLPSAMAHLYLARSAVALDQIDSAHAHMREALRRDAFVAPNADFNPTVVAMFDEVSSTTTAVGIRTAVDTTLDPMSELLPVELVVGVRGRVRLVLERPFAPDSTIDELMVDSTTTLLMSLAPTSTSGLAAGEYSLRADLIGPDSLSATIAMTIDRLAVDTVAHVDPVIPEAYRVETRQGLPSLLTIAKSVGYGLAVVALPTLVNDPDLGGARVPAGAAVLGVTVTVGNLFFDRPDLPVQENIDYNASLRQRVDTRNTQIERDNEATRQQAPLRIRTERR